MMNKIKTVLEKKGMTHSWLSCLFGKSNNMVNAYEQNRTQEKLDTLFEIAKILNLNLKDLINQ
jgi:putative transcriptional regulator